jgi:AI-2 transport protein TqsA
LFFTYAMAPVIDLQMRYLQVRRLVAIVGTVILGLLVLGLFGLLVARTVVSISENFRDYQERFALLTEGVARSLPLHRLGIESEAEIRQVFTLPKDAIGDFISSALSQTTSLISNGVLVVIFMIFLLVGSPGLIPHPSSLRAEIERRIKRYILQLVGFSVLSGVLVGFVLALLGVKYAFVFGFLAFLLNFIPSLGAIIATLLPLPVILLSPELSLTAKVLALVIPGALQFLLGALVQPKIQGGSLELHPVVVLMSLIFFSMIWGMVGAFLATPITAVIKIALEKIPATRPAARVLAGNLDVLFKAEETPETERKPSTVAASEVLETTPPQR